MDSTLPWSQIHDFLAEVGAAGDDQEFIHRVIRQIGALIPCDLDCAFGVIDSAGGLCAPKTIISSPQWFKSFAERYWRLTPDFSQEQGINTKAVDWINYQDTEYGAHFMAPQRIRYSLGIQNIGSYPGGYMGTLALNRSNTSAPFNEREQQITEILQPHLANFYRILTLSQSKESRLPDALQISGMYPSLTRREAEITALLYQRYSTSMIASQLYVSPLTIYKHAENIFTKLDVTSRDELLTKISRDFTKH